MLVKPKGGSTSRIRPGPSRAAQGEPEDPLAADPLKVDAQAGDDQLLVPGRGCIYIYTHVYLYICTGAYTCTYTKIYVYIHMYIYIYMYLYMCTYLHICIHICIHTCVFKYIDIYIYIHIHDMSVCIYLRILI